MALTDPQLMAGARELSRLMYVQAEQVASMTLDDLKAALASIDTSMDLVASGMNQAQTIKQNLVSRLPQPFRTASTQAEKSLALYVWSMVEVGVIVGTP